MCMRADTQAAHVLVTPHAHCCTTWLQCAGFACAKTPCTCAHAVLHYVNRHAVAALMRSPRVT
eukprot:2714177-Alexandrium_andersonii.AAC.1